MRHRQLISFFILALCLSGCASVPLFKAGETMSPVDTLAAWADALKSSDGDQLLVFYEKSDYVIALESTGKIREGYSEIRQM